MTNKLKSLVAVFALTTLGFGLQACNRDSDAENAAEEVSDSVGDAAEDASDSVEDAVEDVSK